MQLTTANTALTMSSRQISEVTNCRHSDVMRSIERLATKGIIYRGYAPRPYTLEQNKQTYFEYHVNKRDSYVIVSQLSPEFTAALVDRWQELERGHNESFVVPTTLSQALRLAADQADQIEAQTKRLEVAEPKAAALDLIAQAPGELCLTDAAKHLQIAPRMLTVWLQAHGWIFKRNGTGSWVAYQEKIDRGLMHHRRVEINRSAGQDVTWQALITPKGIASLAKTLAAQGLLTH